MKIYTIAVPRRMLTRMSEQERDFFLLAGHLANELIILNKLFIGTTWNLPSDKILNRAALVQALFIGKMFVGKLNEGWELLRKRYFGTGLSRDYDPYLADEDREALKRLKRYFSNANIIRDIRSSFAFHYPSEPLEPVISDMQDGDEFEIYLAEENVNSLYYVSEGVINTAMLRDIDSTDLRSAYDQLISETADVFGEFLAFIGGFMAAVVTRHLERDIASLITEEVEIEHVSRLEDVRLPFFVDTSAFRFADNKSSRRGNRVKCAHQLRCSCVGPR